MTTCLECDTPLDALSVAHLKDCCGLTLQEYALRHGLALERVVPEELLDAADLEDAYPHPDDVANPRGQAVLAALACAGLRTVEGPFEIIHGQIRTLDTLLWLGEQLLPLGFQFRQEFHTSAGADRITVTNSLKRPHPSASGLCRFETLGESEKHYFAATLLATCSVRRAAFLTLHVTPHEDLAPFIAWCREAGVGLIELSPVDERVWLRTDTADDAPRLFDLLQVELEQIPQQEERLFDEGPVAMVVKEMDIDAAHFITDHPGNCANLHGGRYTVRFKVFDSIDPATGFVMDYGDLKDVVRRQVVDVLDHRTLNYAVPELAWRSSTELLAVWMWEQLLGYLPNLMELEIHETRTSHCLYRGPTLEEYQEEGSSALLHHFDREDLGRNRRHLGRRPHLRVVGD